MCAHDVPNSMHLWALLTSSASDNEITIEFCGVLVEVITSITRHQMN